MKRKLGSIAAIAATLGICTLMLSEPADADTQASAQTQEPSTSLGLIDQSDWVTGNSPFSMQLKVTTALPTDKVDLLVTVYDSIPNRSQFRETVNGRLSGTPIILDRQRLSEVTARPDGTVDLALPVGDKSQRRFYLQDAGVYPVKVQVISEDNDHQLGSFVTHLINVPNGNASTKLAVDTVLPVRSPMTSPDEPLALPDGGNSVKALATAMANHSDLPLGLLPSPETIDRLSKDTNPAAETALSNLTKSSNGHQVFSGTWAPLPASAYTDEMHDELNRQFDAGRRVIDGRFGSPDTSTWISTQQLDSNALSGLRSRGVQRIVVPESQLAPSPRDTTLGHPFALSMGRSRETMPALQADDGLSAHFDNTRDPVLSAHQLLADIAVIWGDLPGQGRGVVVLPPQTWVANQTFLEIYLRGLASSPVAVAQNTSQLFRLSPEGGGGRSTSVRSLGSIAKGTDSLPTSRIFDVRKRLNGFSDMVAPSNSVSDGFQRRLLWAESAGLDNRARSGLLDNIRSGLQRQLDRIHMPSERSIQLTARQGEIPVSVQNDNDYPIRIRISLSSEKLGFPSGNTRTIDIARQNETERFAVDSRTSGSFPVQVRVSSPDGYLSVTDSRLTVRSTAASWVGVGLSGGAGAFLVLWWAKSFMNARRKPKQPPSTQIAPV